MAGVSHRKRRHCQPVSRSEGVAMSRPRGLDGVVVLFCFLIVVFLTCTFKTSCYSTRLSWTYNPVIYLNISFSESLGGCFSLYILTYLTL